jgi:hypothetical protein
MLLELQMTMTPTVHAFASINPVNQLCSRYG